MQIDANKAVYFQLLIVSINDHATERLGEIGNWKPKKQKRKKYRTFFVNAENRSRYCEGCFFFLIVYHWKCYLLQNKYVLKKLQTLSVSNNKKVELSTSLHKQS